jgi:hypothetical protein
MPEGAPLHQWQKALVTILIKLTPWTDTAVQFELQPTIENRRVRLAPLRADDFDALYAVASDPLIWEQHPNKNRYQRDTAAQAFIWNSLDRQAGTHSSARGSYGGSLYVAAAPRYSALHTCNTWAAEALKAAALPIHSGGVIVACITVVACFFSAYFQFNESLLHDELGQYLNAIKLDAVSIGDSGGGDARLSTDAALAIIGNVDHVHRAVSDMIGRLRPVALDELGLSAAIEHCVDQWRQRIPNTRILLSVDGSFEDLAEPLTLTLYRLIQEGLTNIGKHANAHQAQISLRRVRIEQTGVDEVRLFVTDDGRGMVAAARRTRFGLSGMRERVEMSGGTFVLASAPGHGLKFEACLPAKGAGQ